MRGKSFSISIAGVVEQLMSPSTPKKHLFRFWEKNDDRRRGAVEHFFLSQHSLDFAVPDFAVPILLEVHEHRW
jgi:hypothetical protein